MTVDQGLTVGGLRDEVVDALARHRQQDRAAGRPTLTGDEEREFARATLLDLLHAANAAAIAAGQPTMSAADHERLCDEVLVAVFGAGRLSDLLADPTIENININGANNVWVRRAGGINERVGPVASSDAELVEMVREMAAYDGLSGRAWDRANPLLDLQLLDGSRLSAAMAVTPWPSVSIRRDRLNHVTLDELQRRGTINAELRAFLSAAIAAGTNIVVAGAPRAGKTTLLRALLAELPPYERLVTVEATLELRLHEMGDAHPNIVPLEARPANSEGFGEVTMAALVTRALRMDPDRIVVGEVLGDEIVSLLKGLTSSGKGSCATIHARSPRDVFERFVIYAMQAPERLEARATERSIPRAVDFIVFVEEIGEHRRVTSVLEVTGYDDGVLSSEIFRAPSPEQLAVPYAAINRADQLAAYGYRHATRGELPWRRPSPSPRSPERALGSRCA